MTKDPLNLPHLRSVVAAATPGPWVHEPFMSGQVSEGGGCVATAENLNNAEHIATFDPPTCLALLDAIETARAELEEFPRALLAKQRDDLRAKCARYEEALREIADGSGILGHGTEYVQTARAALEAGE